jgi:cytochrome c553
MKPILIAALACAPFAALAQESPAARSLAATCANCHGPDGRSVTKEVAPLAGLPKDFLVSTMKAFQDGRRPATVMHQIAKGYTDQQIELIAEYFAARRPQ